ncbi:MAG: ribbon-helix-helix domain-containing protein [Candidatus Bipolaricaulota bacterium]|nr:ribbon-helix-helix domain-containing protein [Candidatus Bipolaricaulota bacterium]
MIRTQIYLDESQKQALKHLSAEQGVSVAELIRLAIDRLLAEERSRTADFEAALNRSFGIWKGHDDLEEDFVRSMRSRWVDRTARSVL